MEAVQEVPTRWLTTLRGYLNFESLRRQIGRVRADLRVAHELVTRLGDANQRLEGQVKSLTVERDQLMEELGRYSVVDPNAKCPGCGATNGSIMAVQSMADQRAYIEHTCASCKFRWPENTVYPDAGRLWGKPAGPPVPEGRVISVRTP